MSMPPSRLVLLFMLFMCAGGIGGLGGSIVGAFFGRYGLFVGGVIGGVLCAPAAVVVARWLRWLRRDQMKSAAVGAVIGFGAAVLVAASTLSSPIGPVLGTTLVGVGGLLGALKPWKE
jgi:hypothetical protein